MRKTYFTWNVAIVVLVPVVLGGACREAEPPVAYNDDLGSGDTILLPTSDQWHNKALASGRAEWHEFRGPDEVGGMDDDAKTAPDGHADGDLNENAIRDLLSEFGKVAADDPTVDDLLDYFVADQHEMLEPILSNALDMGDALRAVRSELAAKLPDKSASVTATFETLDASTLLAPSADSFAPMKDGLITAKMAGASLAASYDFVLVDSDWYIKMSRNAPMITKAESDARLTMYSGWADGLDAGELTADAVLIQAVEAAKNVNLPTQGADADTKPSTTEAPAEND